MTERERMLDFADAVRAGRIIGSGGKPFTLVVNIGIGGSDLGPAMAVLALAAVHHRRAAGASSSPTSMAATCTMCCKDADRRDHAVHRRLQDLHHARDPDQRARPRARGWWASWAKASSPQHFAAVSTNHKAMDEFGVHKDYRFQMWDWVGGRYSLWSSIGVSLAIAIGKTQFWQFLAGGA